HTLTECVLDALQQGLALFELLARGLAVGIALESAELEIAARRILEALAFERLDLPHDPLVDSVREQENLDPPLLQPLDVGARPSRFDTVGDQEVNALLSG